MAILGATSLVKNAKEQTPIGVKNIFFLKQ
jgi:hypothetical protein